MSFSHLLSILFCIANLAIANTVNLDLTKHVTIPTIYIMENNPAGASILALSIFSDGRLSNPIRTSTRGVGERAIAADGGPSGPDSLFTQDSVVVGDNYLLSVNAGSDTLSLFNIDPLSPISPTLAGSPANTLGNFPASVAYSSELKIACVLNGGSEGGVSCFSVSSQGLTTLDTIARSVSPALNQPTPPIFINQTASDIFFNPSSTALFAIVKGNANVNLPSSFFVWPILEGKVSTDPVISQVPDVFLAFGATFINETFFAIADVAFGTSVLEVGEDWSIEERAHVVVTDEKAICWATYVKSLNSVFLTDGGESNIAVLNAISGELDPTIAFNASYNGGFDNVEFKGKLYVLTGVGSIVVLDLGNEGKEIQNVDLSGGGDKTGFEGLALWG
ncbi:hypothetical protein B7494_g8532 [Chlorociboria aeruginascens]|nr:hypothetical protein B7494_g8532 [Chlorociboria aeruginascens]